LDSKPFMKEIFTAFFGLPSKSFVSILKNQPSPLDNAVAKFEYLYTGPLTTEIHDIVEKCESDNKLVAYVSKLVDTQDSEHFYALVRVLSGSIKPNEVIKLLGEEYSSNNNEDYKEQKISKCYMWCGRYKVEVPELNSGSIGLVSGPRMDQFIVKSATIYDISFEEPLYIFKGIDRLFPPVFKVAVQAYNPKDLNQFLESLKKLHRSYVGCEVRVADNGEHSILGFGELYMDCLLHDFRILYGGIDIKVSDPMVKFNESTDELSKIKLVTKSNNGKNSISIIAEPLNEKIASDIRNGILSIKRDSPRKFAKKLRDKYQWDSFAARSVWSIGPDEQGTCLFCDDTLPTEVDKTLLQSFKNTILKGFQWAVKEGPLCDEPVSDVKFSIIDVKFADEESDRNDAQIIQMIRKACHGALLIGVPKLLEPIYQIESISHLDALDALERLIDKRRGFVIAKDRIEGTPLWKVNGLIPVIESVGLETDLRLSTRGLAYPQMIFSKWDKVPGDPLDDTVFIPLLKRVPLLSSSRDFMMKTRRRKGLTDEVSLEKYVDNETWNLLLELGVA
jgi:translation elongation factor EF-G